MQETAKKIRHKQIRRYILFAGLLSLQESVYHGVPVLGLPVFGDQDINILQAVNIGFGLFQEILDVKEDELLGKINQLLTDTRYANFYESTVPISRCRMC